MIVSSPDDVANVVVRRANADRRRRSEAGIRGKSHKEAAAIRTAEVEQACRILGARPVFTGQVDGATEVSRARTEALAALIKAAEPDVLLTHWPLDAHPDHQQDGERIYRDYHRAMEGFRGRERGVRATEAFVTLAHDGGKRSLPGPG